MISSDKIIYYKHTNSSAKSLIIKIDNLHIHGGAFDYDKDFLILTAGPEILNFVVNVTNSIIETIFYESSFIKEK